MNTTVMEPACKLALEANFGSVQQWAADFSAIGRAAAGPGQVQLVFKPNEGTLANLWLGEGARAADSSVPILALPLPGPAAAGTIDTFVQHINWPEAYQRYQHAVHAASEAWAATQDEVGQALLLDVRRAGVFERARALIQGAHWRDPAHVAAWAGEMPAGREVIVYCVYGHEVGRATALRLRAAGVNARYLSGGFDAWQAAGLPLADKTP
jgi:superoxide dismutase, Fe-Mn family